MAEIFKMVPEFISIRKPGENFKPRAENQLEFHDTPKKYNLLITNVKIFIDVVENIFLKFPHVILFLKLG